MLYSFVLVILFSAGSSNAVTVPMKSEEACNRAKAVAIATLPVRSASCLYVH